MFTGIVEELGKLIKIEQDRGNKIFSLKASIGSELRIDQSLAHDGVCLTITTIDPENSTYKVTAIAETLKRSTLDNWREGQFVNLERCMAADGRFDGHIVQGHVDQTALCTEIEEMNGSWRYCFSYNSKEGNITVPKGSITINGVSLTVVNPVKGAFEVAIIPYTFENTNFGKLNVGDRVNLEFDIIGKYVQGMLNQMA